MSRATPLVLPARPWTGHAFLPDLRLGLDNLRAHKLRTLLTMLGMIFGVAAVVSMLSIGAGAQQQMMSFIEQMGVRNLIVEAHEVSSWEALQQRRRVSPGLTLQDLRVIQATVAGIAAATPRKRFAPAKVLPKPRQAMPVVYGVNPSYPQIENLRMVTGRFFDGGESASAAAVCVLGQAAGANLFGAQPAVGQYVKVNDQWFHVIGVAGPQLSLSTQTAGIPAQDLNNLIYVPVTSALLRLESSTSGYQDEIDGIYLQLKPGIDSASAAQVVEGILDASHHHANDFSLIVPAELLSQQRRTKRLFNVVMVAIASISLVVGGIGIMNIMLAGILERTREIGVRRAVGARRADILRQFLIEATMISVAGGLIGIVFGFGMSRLIALLAGWSTIVTVSSIVLAFAVSVSVGLIFGTYPASKAARLDPVEAIRYE